MRPSIRHATAEDSAFLAKMLGEAMAWRPGSPKPDPALVMASRYVAGWPKPGDGGVVAEDGTLLGAAWYRVLPPEDPGYGFVDERTPEITVGVEAQWRGQGVGRLLLRALCAHAREDGHEALSLSVEADNYALGLYQSVGFEQVKLIGNAWTMVIDLAARIDDLAQRHWGDHDQGHGHR
jgi:GNAT superfamily N-acetyltransferase